MQPLSRAARGALVSLLRDAPLSQGKVDFAWKAVVGPALQRATWVRLDGGTLVVEAVSAEWSREVSRSASPILRRLQEYLGEATVQGLSVRIRS